MTPGLKHTVAVTKLLLRRARDAKAAGRPDLLVYRDRWRYTVTFRDGEGDLWRVDRKVPKGSGHVWKPATAFTHDRETGAFAVVEREKDIVVAFPEASPCS